MSNEPRDEGRFPDPPSDEDIAERLRKVREELSGMELPELPEDEVEAKSIELQEKVAAARRRSFPDPPELEVNRPHQKQLEDPGYRGLGIGMSVAYSLVGCVVVGWGIGKLIDMQTGGALGQAIGTLLGAVGGLAASIMMIMRAGDRDK
jgi:F0F1-type ATP synthase assembly protein I